MSVINPPGVEANVTEKSGKLATPWLRWIAQAQVILASLQTYGEVSVQVPSNGFSIAAASNKGILILDPAAGLASGTIILPANPVDKQQFQASTTKAIAAITVTASGATVKNPTFGLTAGAGFAYYYQSSNTTWYRLF